MRIGIVADVHSNVHALKVVFEALDALDLDGIVCAGDIVGYGAYPNECCRDVQRMVGYVIAGNHDRSATTRDVSGLNPYAAAAAVWTHDNLNGASADFLSTLPMTLRGDFGGRTAAVFHGSDREPNRYVYEEDVDEDMPARCSSDLVVLGHTHIPFAVSKKEGIVVNPGSVGQPRDGDPRASYAVVDMDSLACEIGRVEYDVEAASRAILEEGLPATLAHRLSIGR